MIDIDYMNPPADCEQCSFKKNKSCYLLYTKCPVFWTELSEHIAKENKKNGQKKRTIGSN